MINNALGGIKWKEALENALHLGENIATAANSFIHETDFELIGSTVANFILKSVNKWYGFVTTFDFSQLGQKIGDSINGFVNEMNKVDKKTGLTGWEELAKTISGLVEGITETLSTAIKTIKWEDVFAGIKEFFKGMTPETWETLLTASALKVLASSFGSTIKGRLNGTKIAGVALAFTGLSVADASFTQNGVNLGGAVGSAIMIALGAVAAGVGLEIALGTALGITFGKVIAHATGSDFSVGELVEAIQDAIYDDDLDVSIPGFIEFQMDELWYAIHGKGHDGGGTALDVPVNGNVTKITDGRSDAEKEKNYLEITGKIVKAIDATKKPEDKTIGGMIGNIAKTTINGLTDKDKTIPNVTAGVTKFTSDITQKYKDAHKIGGVTAGLTKYTADITQKYKDSHKVSGVTAGLTKYTLGFTSSYLKKNPITGLYAKIGATPSIDSKYKTISLDANVKKITVSEQAKKTIFSSTWDAAWNYHPKAKGGVYQHGSWSNIQQYAGGGPVNVNYGTAFVAGEAGPEVVGHIGGRTEVLNESQLASVMYDSVVAGMTAVMRQYGGSNVSVQIDGKEVFNAVRNQDRQYSNINGHSAFVY